MKPSARPSAWISVALASAALQACAVGPNFKTPAPPVAATYFPQAPPVSAPADRIDPRWWRAFGSPALDAMVDEALKASPDLKSADAALRQANELASAQFGALLPSADFAYQGQKAKDSGSLSPVLASNSEPYTLHTAQVTVSYTLDVFGGLRRQLEQAKAQAKAQDFQYQAARTALIANVISAAVQVSALEEQVRATQASVEAGRSILTLIRRQVDLGALGQGDLAAQETQIAQGEAALPPLQKALQQQQSALAVLLGREPGQGTPATVPLDSITLPAGVPVALPAQLVRQRPDILAAEANLHAASAGVGVAIAARLPSLTLTAIAGGASSQFSNLLANDNNLWSIAGGVAQPIFQGGALLHRQKAAEAALDQAKAQYRSTVLGALKNVADSLDALDRDGQGLNAAAVAEAASARSLSFAQRQVVLGEVGTLAALNAQQAHAQASTALAAARAARYADVAALFTALGGGWS